MKPRREPICYAGETAHASLRDSCANVLIVPQPRSIAAFGDATVFHDIAIVGDPKRAGDILLHTGDSNTAITDPRDSLKDLAGDLRSKS